MSYLVFLALVYLSVANSGSLSSILKNQNLQFIFLGGKGGVGKTTTSCAFASKLVAERKGPVLLISTDPAHSISDAFKQEFDGTPRPVDGIDGLEVMEIDPQIQLQAEIKTWAKIAKEGGYEIAKEIEKFQSWLMSMPGIDEATALASVINLVENGKYSAIVFDTAPTGHTLKLLQFPEVMQVGLDQLSSWQSKLWGYYEMFSAFGGGGKNKDSSRLKARIENKLKLYKAGIEKVGKMLKNQKKTTFITVCIAESLSISETQRLIQQLDSYHIHSSHIVVNQLVSSPSKETLEKLNSLEGDEALLREVKNMADLVSSRSAIQAKYLRVLEESKEGKGKVIVRVPLLASEVTGPERILDFAELLTGNTVSTTGKDDL